MFPFSFRQIVSMYKSLTYGCVKKLGTDSRACIQGFYFSVAFGTASFWCAHNGHQTPCALQSVPNFFTVRYVRGAVSRRRYR